MPSNSQPHVKNGQDSGSENEVWHLRRRHFLGAATGITAVVGITAAAYPFLESLLPSEKARAEGGPVAVDIAALRPGEQTTVIWRGKPVWILHRTSDEIRALSSEALRTELRDPDSDESEQPEYARNSNRSLRPEYFVCIASCTHLGCVPLLQAGIEQGTEDGPPAPGYFCPCHGSKFDLAGRVFKHVPAPKNLVVPPYRFASDGKVIIGAGAA